MPTYEDESIKLPSIYAINTITPYNCNTTLPSLCLESIVENGKHNYRLYGNYRQDVTPSPEYPSEIISVGNLVTEGVYEGKYKIGLTSTGKNKYNKDNCTDGYSIDSTGSITVDPVGSHNKYTELIPVFPNINYMFSSVASENSTTRIHAYDLSGNWISQLAETTIENVGPYSIAFSINSTNIIYIRISQCSTDTNSQLEENSIVTDYVPYSITRNIYLDQPLRAIPSISTGFCNLRIGDNYYIADYIDYKRQKVFRYLNSIVLDGSENWSNPNTNQFNVDGATANALYTANISSVMSNRYEVVNNTPTNTDFINETTDYNYAVNVGTSSHLRFKDTRFSNLNDFKTELATNNIEVIYRITNCTMEDIIIPTLEIPDNTETMTDSVVQPLEIENTTEDSILETTNPTGHMVYKYKCYGNTTQATRSGKNLLQTQNSSGTLYGVDFTIEDGVLTLNGTATIEFDLSLSTNLNELFQSGTYTFSKTVISGTKSGGQMNLIARPGNTKYVALSNVDSNQCNFSNDTNVTGFSLWLGGAGKVYDNYKIKFQIEEGTIATEYEPYGISPSPDFPSEILSVGDLITNEYTQVEYLEGTGTQYIDTGFKPDQDTRIQIKFDMLAETNFNNPFGARNNNVEQFFIGTRYTSNGVWFSRYGVTQNVHYNGTKLGIHIVDFNKNIINIDGDVFEFGTETFQSNNSMYLFACNNNGSTNDRKAQTRIYYTKIYDRDVLVRDFIPCYRNIDNVAGMYDLVNNVFYTNQGTDSFVVGGTCPTTTSVFGKYKVEYQNNSINRLNATGTTLVSNGITSITKNNTITCNGTTTTTWFDLQTEAQKFYCEMNAGTTYTISFKNPLQYGLSIRAFFEDGTTNSYACYITGGTKIKTYTPPKNIKHIRFFVDGTTTREIINDLKIENIMIEEGAVAHDYVPYSSNIITVYLNEPLRALKSDNTNYNLQIGDNYYITDYFDLKKQKVRRALGSVTFDGTENFGNNGAFNEFEEFVSPVIDNILPLCSPYILLSNYFLPFTTETYNRTNGTTPSGKIRFDFNHNVLGTTIDTTDATRKTLCKEWFRTHNTEVIYPLATPTEEDVTIYVGSTIREVSTLDSTTTLTTNTVIQPLEIEKTIEYVQQDCISYGNSKQVTRAGYNLFNTSLAGFTDSETQQMGNLVATRNSDGSITFNGTNDSTDTYYYILDITDFENGLYYFYLLGAPTESSSTMYHLVQSQEDFYSISGITHTSFEKTTRTGWWRYIIVFRPGYVCDNLTLYPVISKTPQTEYEQYGVIPNPDSPSEIQSVGNLILDRNYTRVEYIESTGTQYIDTDFKPNQNSRVQMDFSINRISGTEGYDAIFGYRDVGTKQFFMGIQTDSDLYNFFVRYNTLSKQLGSGEIKYPKIGRHSVDFNKNVISIDNSKQTFTESSFECSENMYLFACNNNNNSMINNKLQGKIYKCKIYDDNTLVRDFIPCYRNIDNVVGLYDKVNNTFYTNSGTGTFSYGSLVTPENYKITYTNKDLNDNILNTATVYTDKPINALKGTVDNYNLKINNNYYIADYINFNRQEIIRNVNEVILNGDEDWFEYPTTAASDGYYRFRCLISNNTGTGIRNLIATNNYFLTRIAQSQGSYEYLMVQRDTTDGEYVYIQSTRFTTVMDLKTWLSTHNVNLLYETAVPIFEKAKMVYVPYNEVINTVFSVQTSTPPLLITGKYYNVENVDSVVDK